MLITSKRIYKGIFGLSILVGWTLIDMKMKLLDKRSDLNYRLKGLFVSNHMTKTAFNSKMYMI